jgi:hypothetical protein
MGTPFVLKSIKIKENASKYFTILFSFFSHWPAVAEVNKKLPKVASVTPLLKPFLTHLADQVLLHKIVYHIFRTCIMCLFATPVPHTQHILCRTTASRNMLHVIRI